MVYDVRLSIMDEIIRWHEQSYGFKFIILNAWIYVVGYNVNLITHLQNAYLVDFEK